MKPQDDAQFLKHYVAANRFADQGHFASSDEEFCKALSRFPNHDITRFLHGNVLYRLKRYGDALQAYRHAVDLNPNLMPAMGGMMAMQRELCMFGATEATERQLVRSLRAGAAPWISPTDAFAIESLSAIELLEISRIAALRVLGGRVGPKQRGAGARARLKRPMRVGYLSGDFHDHATMRLALGVLEAHDRHRVTVHCYSCGPDVQDETRLRVAAASEVFRDVRLLSDEAAAKVMDDDDLDLIVDLSGPLVGGRQRATALASAAVVNWLGYPGTFGDRRLAQYIIGDGVVTPTGAETEYSERIVSLPGCYQPNSARPSLQQVPARASLGLPDQGIVFCSFNQSYKITARMLSIWCTLVRRTPNSVLWLSNPNDSMAKRNLLSFALDFGVASERIVFAPFTTQQKHLERLQCADLALDTFPVTSHTTASDALWAGVPLIAMRGDTFVARVSASILTTAGLGELVAASEEEYLAIATTLATNPDVLMQMRRQVEIGRISSPLFDTDAFVENLEAAYDAICESEAESTRGSRVP